jgi:hypothetical protein
VNNGFTAVRPVVADCGVAAMAPIAAAVMAMRIIAGM